MYPAISYKRKASPQSYRGRSPLVIGGHIVQRALLLVLVACFAMYTVVEYLWTSATLAQCASINIIDTRSVLPDGQTVLTETNSKNTWSDSNSIAGPGSLDHRTSDSVVDGEGQKTFIPAGGVFDDAEYESGETGAAIDGESEGLRTRAAAIGKVTMSYGHWADDENNKRILEGHEAYAKLHGHSFHVLRKQTMHGLWSKLAYMLRIILSELERPEDDRIQWLFWFDLDIIVMNPNIPLDIFLPPEDGFSHINILVTNDHHGLNSGAFFLRVNEWAVRYLVDILALRTFRPDIELKYSDQSAMEIMTLDTKYVNNTMYVPQRWFNAYRGPRDDRERLIKGSPVPENTIKPGDLQLHFAGKKVKHLVPVYLELAANTSSGWAVPLSKTTLEMEIARFWKLVHEKDTWARPV